MCVCGCRRGCGVLCVDAVGVVSRVRVAVACMDASVYASVYATTTTSSVPAPSPPNLTSLDACVPPVTRSTAASASAVSSLLPTHAIRSSRLSLLACLALMPSMTTPLRWQRARLLLSLVMSVALYKSVGKATPPPMPSTPRTPHTMHNARVLLLAQAGSRACVGGQSPW